MEIRVTYTSIDRCRTTRKFKTTAGAQKFAQKYVGKTPEVSETFNYAVSGDGVGKIEANVPVKTLFPELNDPQEALRFEQHGR